MNSDKRILRIIKILRILKIVRLIKAVKVVEYVFSRNQINIPLNKSYHLCDRTIEDYAVVYLGSILFKITRLVIVAMFTVHFGACIFFRVKMNSADSAEDVSSFYAENHIRDNVGAADCLHDVLYTDV